MASRFLVLATLSLLSLSGAATAAPDPEGAAKVFAESKAISERDGGALWGTAEYGPMVIVDPNDRSAIANVADADGVLKPSGKFYTGVLPETVLISNTPIEWSGTRWTELMWPLHPKGDPSAQIGDDWRPVMLAHEMFHRIQPGLKLTRDEAANRHMDTLEGRYLLQLEWRALAKALTAPNAAARRTAVTDVLLFRGERHRLFPDAAADENTLDINEGIAEYTGVRLGLATPAARVRYAIYDLSAFTDAASFVRTFSYAYGPAYGLLLDAADPAWRSKLNSGQRFEQLMSAAFKLPPPALDSLKAREAVYDDGSLRASEEKHETAKQARLAILKAALVDGPVVVLPARHANYQFNPQMLVALSPYGTVYPTMRLVAEWGILEVESGGALLDKTVATVSAAGIDPSRTSGAGWRLTLNKGWSVQPGPRPGDFVVKPAGDATAPH